VAREGEPVQIRSAGAGKEDWLVSWHPPPDPPDGIPHGAEGVCVTPTGDVVLISSDGTAWELPAGRPDVELGPWDPQFEIPYRRVVAPAAAWANFADHPFGAFVRRERLEAGVSPTRHAGGRRPPPG
jgi:hypothetical protein